MLRRWIVVVAAPLVAAGLALAEAKPHDWPQWQGPGRSAISKETGLLKAWPDGGPPLAWKIDGLGEGYSTPSVAGGRIYVMGNRDGTEYVFALNEGDGKEVWAAATGQVRGGGGGYPGPRCTPTVDGEFIYALGLNGDLSCLKVADGAIAWAKNLRKEFQGSVGGWGYSESPLIDGNVLVCTPGGRNATVVGLDKKTGKLLWKSSVPEGDSAAYSSPIVADMKGQKQYVQFLSRGVVGVSAKDGRFLWRYDRPANGTANCSTPIYHDGHVFAASGYGTGGGLAKLGGARPTEVYFSKKMQNHHGGMVLLDGCVYGSNEGQLTCLDFKTGKVRWEDRKPGKGSIAVADGMIYYRNEGGPVVLAEAKPDGYVEHGRFSPPRSGKPAWPHPVIANGKLYLRDQEVLLCYDVKQR